MSNNVGIAFPPHDPMGHFQPLEDLIITPVFRKDKPKRAVATGEDFPYLLGI